VQDPSTDPKIVANGARQYKQVTLVAICIGLLLLIEEIVTWNALAFVIVQAVLLCLLCGLAYYVGKTGRLRWGLFMTIMASGVYGFLLGGLHLSDPKESAVDPLCYWLALAGLATLGLGSYLLYSLEIDAFLTKTRGPQA
jgi:hypothetical protein